MKGNVVIVELFDNYFVEVDELNHTLKQRYIGKDKDKNDKEAERIIGYFNNMKQCVEKLARLNVLDENDGKHISIKEYAESAENAFLKVKDLDL